MFPHQHSFADGFPIETKNALQRRNHEMVVKDPLAVLSAGYKTAKILDGYGDSRRQGKSAIVKI